MNLIEFCPVCNNTSFKKFLEVKDYFLTKEKFTIVECSSCGFHFTNPIPKESELGNYYQSEKYVSHSSNKKGVINFIYHLVRKRTLKQKVRIVKNNIIGRNLLDVGSATGHFLKEAQNSGLQTMGVEPNEAARKYAQEVNKVQSLSNQEMKSIPVHSYDAITLWHVLEHVYQLQEYIQRFSEILMPNGKLFIAVPNMNSFDARHYKKYWAAYDVPRHLYHFKQIDIVRLMLNFNFELDKVIPMKYDAYYVSMLSEKYRSRMLPFGFVIGCISNMKAKKYGYSSHIYVFEKK